MAERTTRSQKSLETKRLWPRSKMYWMPCSELASPYSAAVCEAASLGTHKYDVNTEGGSHFKYMLERKKGTILLSKSQA